MIGKPIYIIRPQIGYCPAIGAVPYYYKEELKEKGLM